MNLVKEFLALCVLASHWLSIQYMECTKYEADLKMDHFLYL